MKKNLLVACLVIVALLLGLFACASAESSDVSDEVAQNGRPENFSLDVPSYATLQSVFYRLENGMEDDWNAAHLYDYESKHEAGQTEPGFIGFIIYYDALDGFYDDVTSYGQQCDYRGLELNGQVLESHYRATTDDSNFIQWCVENAPKQVSVYYVTMSEHDGVYTFVAEAQIWPLKVVVNPEE